MADERDVSMNDGDRLIPDNERWLHEPDVKSEVDEAIAWAVQTPPAESKLLKEPKNRISRALSN